MKRIVIAIVLSLVGATSAQAVTLVSLTGQPEPMWQRWADEMHVPTVNETVVLFVSKPGVESNCSSVAGACVNFEPVPEIFLDPTSTDRYGLRQLLYHELGHFWGRQLSETDQLRFMRIWNRVPRVLTVSEEWWAGTSGENPEANWGPVEEWFAEGYRLCADYPRWTWRTALDNPYVTFGYRAGMTWEVRVRKARQRWALHAQRATCKLIRSS